jgi:hypothetical protein
MGETGCPNRPTHYISQDIRKTRTWQGPTAIFPGHFDLTPRELEHGIPGIFWGNMFQIHSSSQRVHPPPPPTGSHAASTNQNGQIKNPVPSLRKARSR